MSRHWAILIGVNQYQFRQPLLCAHDDAQSMYQFLTEEANLSTHNCVLISDRSPKVGDISTYPTIDTLKNWLGGLNQAGIKADDQLWIFFSGYGECWKEQDYLLPLDAEAQCSSKTWLSVRALYSILSKLPTQKILLLLDINRSQSSRSGSLIGRQTMQNAKEFGISTILSCQPEQFSHESASLGNGFFTAALLEGLREHRQQPLIKLVRFLQARLPELSEHNYRPRQDPIIMVSPAHLETWLTPTVEKSITAPVSGKPTDVTSPPDTILQAPKTVLQKPTGFTGLDSDNAADGADDLSDNLTLQKPGISRPQERTKGSKEGSTTTISRPAISLDEVSQPNEHNPQPPRRRPRFHDTADEDIDTRKVLIQVLALGALLTVVLGLANTLWKGKDRPSLEDVGRTNNATQPQSPELAPTNAPAQASERPIPTEPSPDPSARLNVPESPPADSAKILEDARAMIRPTNASQVSRAIERASQIPPGDGRYAETQRQIDIWCREIIQLARQRANRGNFRDAISAARLVPTNRGKISQQANTLIRQWQKRAK